MKSENKIKTKTFIISLILICILAVIVYVCVTEFRFGLGKKTVSGDSGAIIPNVMFLNKNDEEQTNNLKKDGTSYMYTKKTDDKLFLILFTIPDSSSKKYTKYTLDCTKKQIKDLNINTPYSVEYKTYKKTNKDGSNGKLTIVDKNLAP